MKTFILPGDDDWREKHNFSNPKMIIDVLRCYDTGNETIGTFLIDGKPYCYTLEDEERTIKKWGETRIPEGVYPLGLRTEGGHHERYLKKFPEMHNGMLHVLNVPNFTHILIHIGNTEDDTAGCLLPGTLAPNFKSIVRSTDAYKKIYPIITQPILAGRDVRIRYSRIYP